MSVTVELTDIEYAKLSFEKFLEFNKLSRDKEDDGTYHYRETRNMWVAFQYGFRKGRDSSNGTCEF